MSKLFDVEHQLTFYGQNHVAKVNFLIHVFGVPLLFWSGAVFAASFPWPQSFPQMTPVELTPYFTVALNWATLLVSSFWLYYLTLEPASALLFIPQALITFLTAESYASKPDGLRNAGIVHVISWIAQFIGHGVFEGRKPALVDNLLGAVVLAPFFVHLELLFALGWKPEFHRKMKNSIGRAVTQFRKEQAEKKRTQAKKDL
ncbi:DUF962-domain-containing protein [Auriculariales sp. MPI-PUGE-AT-0066]|nr:DUF962-domain-containing protein [Auriculariales sp. MPI-PUGE-AT-0066]